MAGSKTRLFFGAGKTKPILHTEDLLDHLPAERRHHYRDGYSMAEAAKCWVESKGRLPRSIAQLVGDDALDIAHFEYPVKVWGRGTSVTDIMAFVPSAPIAVEAKAREIFDEEVRNWIDKRKMENRRSPPHRLRVIDRYAQAFGVRLEALLGLRYQLLHRTLAAAVTARQYGRKRAWMIIQSFASVGSDEHSRNRADFDRFMALVGKAPVLEGVPVRLGWVDEVI